MRILSLIFLVALVAQSGLATFDLESLSHIPLDSPSVPWALLERAKLLYRESRWSEFFATTVYLRTHFSEHSDEASLLESLARLRHCRWDEARALAESAAASRSTKIRHLARSVLAWIPVGADVGLTRPRPGSERAPGNLLPFFSHWPVPQATALELPPEKMRIRVTPRCPDTEEAPIATAHFRD